MDDEPRSSVELVLCNRISSGDRIQARGNRWGGSGSAVVDGQNCAKAIDRMVDHIDT